MTAHDRATTRRARRKWRRLSLALAAGVAATISLAAFGSSAEKSSAFTSSTLSKSAQIAPATAVANATKFLAPYDTAPVTWTGPTTPDPVAKNKHIVFLDIAPTVPTLQTITTATQQLATKLHWTVTHIDVQNQDFQPAVQQAIALHPDGILFNFEDVANDPAAFRELAASHIPVIVFGVSTDPTNSDNPAITHIVNVNYSLQGRLTAAAAALLSHGDSHLGIFTIAGNTEEEDTDGGIASYFKEYGGGSIAGTDYFDQAIIFNPSQVGQAAVAFVQAHPTITQLFVIFDGVAAEVIPALKQAGLGRVQVLSAQGDAYNINLIRTGGQQVGDAVWPYTWATYAAFDDFNRIFDKLPLPKSDGIPVREFYKSDLYSGTGYWNGDYPFASKYDSLWRIG
jgi:ribose transport system substrate-binding protein